MARKGSHTSKTIKAEFVLYDTRTRDWSLAHGAGKRAPDFPPALGKPPTPGTPAGADEEISAFVPPLTLLIYNKIMKLKLEATLLFELPPPVPLCTFAQQEY